MANNTKNSQSNWQAALFGITLSREGGAPLHVQLIEALRALILSGQHSGARLPPSRGLARELSVSRMTVTTAYDQLIAEGYLTARRGAGTFVAEDLPHLATPAPRAATQPARPAEVLPFQPGLPDATLFPHREWARHLDRAWRAPEPALLMRPDLFGWPALRVSIAEHLAVWRGLECHADQIVITAGAWEGFDILCHGVLPAGTLWATEDPGWPVLHDLLRRAGARPVPLRVDAEGLDPARLPQGAGAVSVTPSRQYPTGVAMPLARRLALLSWARGAGGLVIEDDYDSEFRYQGKPLPALSGIDGLRHTVYMGSFSKLLSPALRIGYMVLPERLIGPVRAYMARVGARASLLPQPALAGFMASGEFATHLRRMRRVYAGRQAHLLRALAPVADLLGLGPEPSGMHLVARFGAGLAPDQAVAAKARAAGLSLRALSEHAQLPEPPQGLVLGYTAHDDARMAEAAERLIELVHGLRAGGGSG